MIEAYIDGACEPNPGGTAAWGVLIRLADRRILELKGIVGSGSQMSNNVAEYAALIEFLEWLSARIHEGLKETEVVVRSDSNMLIQQMTGNFKVSKGLYVPYYQGARELLRGIALPVKFKWIPRTGNVADPLAVAALGSVGILRKGR